MWIIPDWYDKKTRHIHHIFQAKLSGNIKGVWYIDGDTLAECTFTESQMFRTKFEALVYQKLGAV